MAGTADIIFPEDQHEGTQSLVGKWLKQLGDPVRRHEPLLEISTDKVSVEIAAPADGVLSEILADEGQEVRAGQILGRIELGAAALAGASPAAAKHRAAPRAGDGGGAAELSPAVRKLLKEHNLTPQQISGSGKDGRITYQDVEAFIAGQGSAAQGSAVPSHKVRHSAMRRQLAQHMTQSLLHTAPHVTSVFEADLADIVEHRERHKAEMERNGTRLTLTAYFVRAAVAAIREVPQANSRWHEDELEIWDDMNIGVGTALGDGGLIAPVIHKAQELDLEQIARALQVLTEKARSGSLASEEVQNGTFTISNHGVSGSLFAAPIIINQPQSAILGIGKLEQRVCVVGEGAAQRTEIRPRAYVTLTIDHRVMDGYSANRFLAAFVAALRNGQ